MAVNSSNPSTASPAAFIGWRRVRAAWLAGGNRTSVYRWLADPDFAAAREAVLDDFFQGHKASMLAPEPARAAWRAGRQPAPPDAVPLPGCRAGRQEAEGAMSRPV